MKARGFVQRAVFTAVVAATCAIAAAAPVQATTRPVTEGSFSFAGDPGEPITGGDSYSFGTAAGNGMEVGGDWTRDIITLRTQGWEITLLASHTLGHGSYVDDNSVRGHSLTLSGPDRHCAQGTGKFDIQNIVWGPQGYVQDLDATFEHKCPDATASARGEVHIKNPEGPAELAIGAKLASDGTFDPATEAAKIHGTVDCNAATEIFVRGSVEQGNPTEGFRKGHYLTRVQCTPGAEVPWTATVRADPMTSLPFHAGEAYALTHAEARDEFYGSSAFGFAEGTVQLV